VVDDERPSPMQLKVTELVGNGEALASGPVPGVHDDRGGSARRSDKEPGDIIGELALHDLNVEFTRDAVNRNRKVTPAPGPQEQIRGGLSARHAQTRPSMN